MKKQQATNMMQLIAFAAYADGVRQGKARERARLRKLARRHNADAVIVDLLKNKVNKRRR